MTMKRLAILSVVAGLGCCGTLLAAEPKAEKRTTQTILFLGDSITAAGGYVRVIEAELAKQAPSNAWKVVNHGKSSICIARMWRPGRSPCNPIWSRLRRSPKQINLALQSQQGNGLSSPCFNGLENPFPFFCL